MRLCGVVVGILTLSCAGARADAISAPTPCPPGEARDGGGGPLGGLGFWGHEGPPPCEPAVCIDASTCGPQQVCRRDAHCLEERTTRELRPSPGHGAPFDPDDPSNQVEVTRTYDLGRCDTEGACPAPARCMMVATCRAAGDVDAAPVARARTDGRPVPGGVASGAWSAGVRYDPSLPLGAEGSAPAAEAAPAGAATTTAEATTEARPTAETPPAIAPIAPASRPSAGTCGCRAASNHRGAPSFVLSVLLTALLARCARRAVTRDRGP